MADLNVVPSVSEPFGIAPLEAMSHDVPVIVSKQSGVSEVVQIKRVSWTNAAKACVNVYGQAIGAMSNGGQRTRDSPARRRRRVLSVLTLPGRNPPHKSSLILATP